MTPDAILSWHDYFLCVATVGATLAGLLFIALTISLQHVLSGMGYLSRAFAALFLQFETLLVGLFGLVPGQPVWLLGAELIATGFAILTGIAVFAHNFREDRSSVLGSTWPHRLRVALTGIGTLLPAAAGIGLIADLPWSLYLLIPAQIAGLYLSIGNAWVIAVEIPRRAAQKSA